jgi:hypothetical protein
MHVSSSLPNGHYCRRGFRHLGSLGQDECAINYKHSKLRPKTVVVFSLVMLFAALDICS